MNRSDGQETPEIKENNETATNILTKSKKNLSEYLGIKIKGTVINIKTMFQIFNKP